MFRKIFIRVLSGFFMLLPALSFGETLPPIDITNNRISQLLRMFSYWTVLLVTIVIGLGLLTFLWGVVQYVASGADEEKRTQARNMMLYGIIALFVMVSVWGLVTVLGTVVGVRSGGGPSGGLPGLPSLVGADEGDTCFGPNATGVNCP